MAQAQDLVSATFVLWAGRLALRVVSDIMRVDVGLLSAADGTGDVDVSADSRSCSCDRRFSACEVEMIARDGPCSNGRET